MTTYVMLVNFTDQGLRHAKDSPKRADAFKYMAEKYGATVKDLKHLSVFVKSETPSLRIVKRAKAWW